MSQSYWMYGLHACKSALENPKRVIKKIYVMQDSLLQYIPRHIPKNIIKRVAKEEIQKVVGFDAVHQGIAMFVDPLPTEKFDILEDDAIGTHACILILDQLNDPHNVGAILRSACAFDVKAVLIPMRNSATESGSLAKAASGALDKIPIIWIQNIAHTLEEIKDYGFWSVGLAEEGDSYLHQVDLKGKIALVMGTEGDGLRSLTKKKCDFLAKIPTSKAFSTLNVSNATAVALYQVFQVHHF